MPTTDEERLARRRRIRAGHKASATRILGQITSALTETPPNADRLSLLKLTLSEKLETLKGLDAEIIEMTPEEGLDDEIGQSDEFKERLYDALTRINKMISSAPTTVTTPSTESRCAEPTADGTAKVKLPKLSLPHFNGDLTKWATFWDSYESAIHSRRELTDVEKFNYLRSLLERSAHDAIAGLTLSSANYREAIDILHKRFGNKQQIISRHMELLLKVDAVPDQNLKSLRRLYDTVESHIRSLKSLGVDSASYGALLCPVLLNKLPSDVRLIISRTVTSSELDMDRLLQAFEDELQARERASDSTSSQRRHYGRSQPTSPTSALFSQNSEPTSGLTCCYCEQAHASPNCTSVTTVSARKQILRTSGRCFNCLRKGHLGRNCRSPGRCQRCKAKHHTSICDLEQRGVSQSPATNPPAKTSTNTSATLDPTAPTYTPTVATHALCPDKRKTILLQTALCILHNPSNPSKSLEVRLLFDTGSQKSYITDRARSLLSLESTEEQHLSIATFGSTKEQTKVCPIVHVELQLRDAPPMSLALYSVPTICEPLVGQAIEACVMQNPRFMELDLADNADRASSLPVDLLIGSDYYWDLVTGGICRGRGGLTAIHTKLGWVLSGPVPGQHSEGCSMNLTTTHVLCADTQITDAGLDAQLRSFWELESLGIHKEEGSVYEDFAKKISFQDGRYTVSLPWMEFHNPLPDNYALSVKRLRGLLRRLYQDPEVLKEYDSTIREQLKKGIIEAVELEEPHTNQVHYLPHHAVIRRDKATTKLRIVYDASAKMDGPSLNECLHKGPSFNQLILDLLLRFRSYRVALTADVEKAFLMIAVHDSDRDVLRFIWVDNIEDKEPKLKVLRFTRVVFGVSSSPFLLNATIKFHLERYMTSDKDTVQKLLHSTYVDDIITGANTEEAAFDLYTRAKDMFRDGGFNLRKFVTNFSSLQQQINQHEGSPGPVPVQGLSYSDETYAKTTLGTPSVEGTGELKVLGVTWNPHDDSLLFDVSQLARLANNLLPITKRNIISFIGRFYDPLGFLTPITVRFKVFFQKLCQSKLDWDGPLPEHLVNEWRVLVSDLGEGVSISVPRHYFDGLNEDPSSITLCGFCDASKYAYAAVVYLKASTETRTSVRFVVSKTRVAPLQVQTIPRLELLSAFLLSKLIVAVAESLKPNLPQLEMQCYTDSLVTLYWIQGTHKEWKAFVQNRVNEIRRNVHPTLWKHTPGRSNPADLPSRGLTALELSTNQLWKEGPEWLRLGTQPPSSNPAAEVMPEECIQELKVTTKSLSLISAESRNTIGDLMTCQNFSTYSRLLRVTAQVLKAVKRFKTGRSTSSDGTNTITPEELAEAETLWIISAQHQFNNEKNFQQQRRKLGLFKDSRGIWRCGGRLSNSDMPYAVKHPILLPRTHPLTALIIQEAHNRVFHNGVKETLTEARRKFWILKGRSLTRSLLHRCILCKRFEGAPFRPPPPPPLPRHRIKDDPAFSYTGVDFAGPLNIRAQGMTTTTKVWICLYTCFVTRAVHLDAVPDSSTQTFIRCLKRFAARRGLPCKFISDNGKTFKSAAKYLKSILSDASVKEYLTGMRSDWVFNLERAPWWGGAFERMVKSTKRCLRKMIGRAHLSMDELLTALAEIEAVINSRPLSYMSPDDVEEPLTPSHLLVGRRLLNLPDHLGYVDEPGEEEFSTDPSTLSRRMKHLNTTLNHFWNRWRTEYLNNLREAHYHANRKSSDREYPYLSVGDVVVVHDEHLPRGLWKLGVVQEIIQGRDGKIRGALVKMAKRDRQKDVLRRPIQLLYPLEITQPNSLPEGTGCQEELTNDPPLSHPNPNNTQADSSQQTVPRRSRRAAAQQADYRRRACMYSLQDD